MNSLLGKTDIISALQDCHNKWYPNQVKTLLVSKDYTH